VTSSVKIGRTAVSSALSYLPLSPSGTRTSPSTESHADEAWTVATEPDPDSNGSWDPLEALRADADEESESAPDPAREAASEPAGRAFAAPSSVRSTLAGVEELSFIRLSEHATLPTRAHDSDAGLDLYAAEGARISPGGRVSVGTGLAVAIPEGLAGLVLPRSGLALKHGVTLVNSPGLIDPGYRGEVRVLLHNTDLTSEFRLAAGDRVAQLILVPIAHASPLESDSLDSTVRGSSGFGSTDA
jgi:dUTP pyrophosphatase